MSQKLTKAREKCVRERVLRRELGRGEINQISKQRATSLRRITSTGGIMLLGNSAQGDGSLWSHQSQSEAKAWFVLSPNGSLPTGQGSELRYWSLSRDNPLLCLLQGQPASFRGLSQRNHTEATPEAILTGPQLSTLSPGLWFFLTFLDSPSSPSWLAGASLPAVCNTTSDPGGEVLPRISSSWVVTH